MLRIAVSVAIAVFALASLVPFCSQATAADSSVSGGKRVVVQQGESDEFTEIDIDKNGVVSRTEWKGPREEFDKRDKNKDGVLSRYEFYQNVWPSKLK
jgi:hypothetical protein